MTRLALLRPPSILLAGLVVAGAAHGQGPPYKCKDEVTGKITFQGAPCPVVNPPPPPPPKLTCSLGDEHLRQARRQEDLFVARYPNESTHRQAQDKDIKPVANRVRDAEERLKDLAEQRKPLDKEREFYVGKQMPSALKSKVDANDAQVTAMTDILRSRKQELADIQARYECERDTFGMMWKNSAPGQSACNRPACAPP